jgi:pimeloyl-ACP methyl ester carboxylesterase
MNELFETSKGKIWYNVIDKGSNKNILLIHGFMEDHEVWNDLVKNLHANIISVDLLGFGNSVPNSSFNFSMIDQSVAINELLTFLAPPNLFVLGHSMGGYITLELFRLNPSIRMGLLHSTIVADSEEKKANRNKTIEVLEKDPTVFIREFYWNLFAEFHKNKFSKQVEVLKQKAEKIPVSYIISTVQALRDRKDQTDLWHNSDNDALWIAGAHDKLISLKELDSLSDDGPAVFVVLKDSGHMGFYEEPENLIEVVNDWLEFT